MRNKILLPKAALIVALTFLAGTSSYALTSAQAKAIRKAVLSVPVPEMPSKAAELVLQSSKIDREATALTAVRAVVFQYKTSASAVVAAVSKVAPDLAPSVAAAAAQLARSEAAYIAQAASSAAPAQTSAINDQVNVTAPAQTARLSVASTTLTATGRGDADITGPTSGRIFSSDHKIHKDPNGQPESFPSNPPTQVPPPHPKPYDQPR